jgi:peptidyl-prolyl cis-trans isomerase D
MLRFFSAMSKSWFGPFVIGLALLALTFLGFTSMRDVFAGKMANAVVQAGSRSVTSREFERMFQRNEQAYLQQTGQAYPLEEAVRQGADQQMLQQLAAQTSYSEMLSRAGIRPPPDVIASELKRQAESGGGASALSEVFDPVTGKFSETGLAKFLAQVQISRDEFFQDLTDSIADQDFTTAVRQGFEPPRIYSALQATLLLEGRDVTYFVIPAASIAKPPPPTDAQLAALIEQFRDRLMLPERRKLTFVRFSAKAIAATMPVDPAAVQQQFEAKKDTYGKPETRTLVEIPLNDPSKAAQVIAALKAGQDPAAVAKSVGVEAVTYTDQPQSAIADRKAADTAFHMTAGQVSDAVQGDFKTVIIKLVAITPGQAPDINAARPQITADLQMQEALDKVYDTTQKFEDLVQGGASLQDAAAKLGLTPNSIGPVTADGKDITTGQPIPTLTPKLLTSAFQLAQGAQSDGVEQDADKGEYYFVHVDQVTAPSPPGLDEPGVRQFLTQAYYQQTIVTALKKMGDDAQAALGKGQTMEAVAATYHATLAHQLAMTRVAAQQLEQSLGQEFLAAAFGAKANATFVAGSDPLKGLAVGHLDAIHPGDPKQVATMLEQLRQQGTQKYMEGLDDATRQAAVRLLHPQTDIKLAHQVMGVDDAMLQRVNHPATNSAAHPAQ